MTRSMLRQFQRFKKWFNFAFIEPSGQPITPVRRPTPNQHRVPRGRVRRRRDLGREVVALPQRVGAAVEPRARGVARRRGEVLEDGVRLALRGPVRRRRRPGQDKSAKFPTSKAPLSAGFHSFRLIFGRAIISRNGLDAWMLFPERARAEHSR